MLPAWERPTQLAVPPSRLSAHTLPADHRVRLPGHVERRAPVPVDVGRELEIPAGTVHPLGDLADAAPVVEPTMGELKFGSHALDGDGGESGAEAAAGVSQFHRAIRASSTAASSGVIHRSNT